MKGLHWYRIYAWACGAFACRTLRHWTGREGYVVGIYPAKKGQGVWVKLRDSQGTWRQYRRVPRSVLAG